MWCIENARCEWLRVQLSTCDRIARGGRYVNTRWVATCNHMQSDLVVWVSIGLRWGTAVYSVCVTFFSSYSQLPSHTSTLAALNELWIFNAAKIEQIDAGLFPYVKPVKLVKKKKSTKKTNSHTNRWWCTAWMYFIHTQIALPWAFYFYWDDVCFVVPWMVSVCS